MRKLYFFGLGFGLGFILAGIIFLLFENSLQSFFNSGNKKTTNKKQQISLNINNNNTKKLETIENNYRYFIELGKFETKEKANKLKLAIEEYSFQILLENEKYRIISQEFDDYIQTIEAIKLIKDKYGIQGIVIKEN